MDEPIDGGSAAYGMHAFEHLGVLNEELKTIRWHILRGEIEGRQFQIWNARRIANALARDLDRMARSLQEAAAEQKASKIKAVS